MFNIELNMESCGSVGDDKSRDRIKYAPFDVESESKTMVNHLNFRGGNGGGEDGVEATGNSERLPADPMSYIWAANVLKTLCFILVWYTFSLFLTLYNKSLLGDHLGRFPAPLLMNTFHFAMQAVLSNAITWFWSERFQVGTTMSWRNYFARVVPTALATALDVNLTNASLVFISVTFATMCKSASPLFLILFAFLFRLESPNLKILGIILIISLGILLTVAKETEFEFWGFIFVMLAAVMSGFRWCMTQILLQREAYGLKNPLTFMSYVTPIMALATAFVSLLLDPWHEFPKSDYFNSSWNIVRSCFLMLFGGMLAFFMVLTEYVLVSVTSAVTVTIAGVVKEAVTIIVAVVYFHDEFTWMKGVGLLTIMIGVSLFNWYKHQKFQKGQTSEDDMDSSAAENIAAKYIILEEMDEQDDGI
ncbi:hypothetical protein Nepgr_009150 [Nepenthes gracilis]|uniref:Sugar phosphate transporter domain-containing protein n=1 Tax=Nepenthes gracilis TaxID=150966 RepID=A0AAD3S9X5_NEPGR|nr:hypothetical protein Nepgr_009150 [Nepenthes gracilis]